jgi:DNA polymerase-3 subunit epsilon
MKRTQLTYVVVLGAFFFLALGAVAAWAFGLWLARRPATLTETQRLLPLGAFLLILLGVGFWLNRFIQAYFFQVRQLNSEARLMLNANPAHRLEPDGPAAVRALGETVNAFGDRFQELQADRDAQIAQARADLAEERNLLAALMAELSDAVLVCNRDGQILLYNRSARRLVNEEGSGGSGFVGLGRSVFGLLDRNAISHGLEQLRYYAERETEGRTSPRVVTFLATMINGRLVRVRMAEVGDGSAEATLSGGFILSFQDMTQGIESSSRRDFILQRMTEQLRASLGGIRAAIETIEAYPEMEPARRLSFDRVIREEAQKLSAELDETMRTYARDLKAQWRLEEMHGSDLLWAISRHFGQKLGVRANLDQVNDDLWLRVDSYAIVHGLTNVMRQLNAEFDIRTVRLCLTAAGPGDRDGARLASFDLAWPMGDYGPAIWRAWSERAYVVDEGDATLTLKEVAERHGGEIWFQLNPANESAYFRLLLPLAQSRSRLPATAATVGTPLESRPEYYDFDLFHQPGQKPELDERNLTDVTYTVFDTETTGLNPAQDEIINIGAVRIVNGRLLRQEVIDYLIDPRRAIPAVATSVHGITNEMVRGRPAIDETLPRFARFAEETVLVAHNAAFDMRMLQNCEAATGVRFINPVLDTLLLSAVVHPDETDHSLEAIARRLGIDVMGRHTALGDAIVTAEVFLGLIRLLADQGITTLGQARAAAEQTYFARIQY